MMVFYLHVLRTRHLAGSRFLVAATMTLFILCTIHCFLRLAVTIIQTRYTFPIIRSPDDFGGMEEYFESYRNLIIAANAIYLTSNVIADAIFIFRCYAIWNFRLKIVLFPILLTLGVAVIGSFNIVEAFPLSTTSRRDVHFFELRSAAGFSLPFSMVISVTTTLVLMVLSVGRIWWLARAAQHLMGKEVMGKYYTVSAMILESGALYFTGGLVFAILLFVTGTFPNTETSVVLGQIVGIAPTIITVRVGLGYSVESVDSFISPEAAPPTQIRFASAPRVVDSDGDHVIYIRRESIREGRRDEEERQ
ncbi:hypothetical protein B0H14DRAFT_2783179 [Mycena olivaceomarginata]|nr:hypothetical protein B0H14DRAFT_2783179 [Mycena olivaceomarginata]